jgi:hypothetical protein
MAELRRANHLWSSDSIHLRKVLYIPLDNPSHLSVIKPLIDLDEPMSKPPSEPYHCKSDNTTIRRIPASQLSFFPPPSKPSVPRNMNSHDLIYNQPSYVSAPSSVRSGPSSGSGSPGHPSRALASILTALPMAASTRDTIIARLSLESERTSASDDQEHELDEVHAPARDKRNGGNTYSTRSRSLSSPRFAPRSISPSTPVNHQKSWIHTDVVEAHAPIRTVQLEPSPDMKLPPRIPKHKSRSSELVESGVDELAPRR